MAELAYEECTWYLTGGLKWYGKSQLCVVNGRAIQGYKCVIVLASEINDWYSC